MTLHNWKPQYIRGIGRGKNPDALLGELKINQWTLDEALKDDAAFAAGVEGARAGGVVGDEVTLCAAELKKLREAQVNESRVAGYFGMTVDEFRVALKSDPELSKVNEMAMLRGQALIQMGQYDAAVTGDTDMLKWLGKNHLDQAEKTETKVTVEEITDPKELAKRMVFLNAKAGLVIEGVAVEIPLLPDTDEDTINPDGTLLLQSK